MSFLRYVALKFLFGVILLRWRDVPVPVAGIYHCYRVNFLLLNLVDHARLLRHAGDAETIKMKSCQKLGKFGTTYYLKLKIVMNSVTFMKDFIKVKV